jgi:hypothetical protein
VGVGLILPEHIAKVWPTVAVWIRRGLAACPYVPISLAATRARLARRRYALLVAAVGEELVAAAVLEHVELRGTRYLTIIAAGGERARSLELAGPPLWQAIERIAKGLGVDSIRLRGRPGWLRWIRSSGRLREVTVDYVVR